MAKSFGDIFVSLILVGLIIFSMFSFGVIMQSDNQANDTLIKNADFNKSYYDLDTNLAKLRNQTQDQRTAFEEDSPFTAFGSIVLKTIVSSGTVFTSLLMSIFNILINLPTSLFGVSKIVSGVITSILIVTVIIGLWILYKLGG